MANITVKDLNTSSISGADLFNDSESFMRDLSEYELETHGGIFPTSLFPTTIIIISTIYRTIV
jgi:hypothetical protein